MTRMTGPDCAVMCNLINTHTHTHMYIIRDFHVTTEIRFFALMSKKEKVLGRGGQNGF